MAAAVELPSAAACERKGLECSLGGPPAKDPVLSPPDAAPCVSNMDKEIQRADAVALTEPIGKRSEPANWCTPSGVLC